MDKSQVNTLLNRIADFENLNFENIVTEIYSKQNDLTNVRVNILSLTEYISLVNRVIKQLKLELTGINILFYPMYINLQNEFGVINLENELSAFIQRVRNTQLGNSEQHIINIARYEVFCGFFDKSNIKVHDLRGLRLGNIEEKLNIQSNHLERNIKIKDEIFNEIKEQQNEINEFLELKKKEFDLLSQLSTNANKEANNISVQLNNSISASAKIDSIYEQQNSALISIKNLITEAQAMVLNYDADNKKYIKSFKSNEALVKDMMDNFTTKLNEIDGKKEYFDGRNKYLDELIGREVGASLFETFRQRKIELDKPLNFWKWSSLAMSIITVLGVWAVFTNLFGILGNGASTAELTWQKFALNSLKTTPFFVLLFFTIRQYTRERTFQEEYAFKSAVALTIDAYSKLLSEMENKDKLIYNAVTGIYNSPIISKEKHEPVEKSFIDILKNSTETIKNITSKKNSQS